MFFQFVSLLGAALLLGAFFANSRGWIHAQDRLYGALNFFGALLLLWVAIVDQRLGFIILEVTWAAISIPAILKPDASRVVPGP